MRFIQNNISERALELLNLPPNQPGCMLLDIGCGSGMSGRVLEKHGHAWIGMDVSRSMLEVAQEDNLRLKDNEDMEEDDEEEEEKEFPYLAGDLLEKDMGQGLGFRAGTFDGAISISAVQWLCYSHKTHEIPKLRLKAFFSSLFASLRKGMGVVGAH